MRAVLPLLALVVVAAGCGSSAAPEPSGPGPGRIVYQGSEWAVVLDHGKASAQHLVDGVWVPDTGGAVTVSILGPRPGSRGNSATPQVAAELRAPTELVDSALWIDGVELLTKGGGLTPTRGTIYGGPATPLRAGSHTAIAYARTAANATAVAWTFSTS